MYRQYEDEEFIVKQAFGPDAELQTSSGSAVSAGELRIVLEGEVIGRGPTLAAALTEAQRAAALISGPMELELPIGPMAGHLGAGW